MRTVQLVWTRVLADCHRRLGVLALGTGMIACGQATDRDDTSRGTIRLTDGSVIQFDRVRSLRFSLTDTTTAERSLTDWPLEYDPTSPARSMPLAWVASIEVIDHEAGTDCQCLLRPTVAVTSTNGVEFRTKPETLEWIEVETGGDRRQVYFANDGLAIRSIVLVD